MVKTLAKHTEVVLEFGSVSEYVKLNMEAGMQTAGNFKDLSVYLQ